MAGYDGCLELLRENYGTGSHRVEANVHVCGKDLAVVLAGGTHYHVGAVALTVPRPSLADSTQVSASASVLCVTGHKEDELARETALHFASSLKKCTVTVIAGIHMDAAQAHDISELMANCNYGIEKMLDRLKIKLGVL